MPIGLSKLGTRTGLLLLGLTSACARPAPVFYQADLVFPIAEGQYWSMSDQHGNKTFFYVQGLPSYQACQTGEFINLRITKTATESYWAPGTPGAWVNTILMRDQNSWRIVSEVAGASPPTDWMAAIETVQKDPIPGKPLPYFILPTEIARGGRITQQTEYIARSVWNRDDSACIIPAEVNNPPGTFGGLEPWHTIFTVDSVDTPAYAGPAVKADFLGDNHEEAWYFAPKVGLVEITDGGLILKRDEEPTDGH